MTLEYQVVSPAVQEIEAKLKELALAFTKKQVTDIEGPRLIDGQKIINGHRPILEHLGDLAGELNSWYYCV